MSKENRHLQYIFPKSLTIKTGNNTLTKINPNSNVTSIAIRDQFQASNIGLRLNQYSLDSITLSKIKKEVIIGILLGDGIIRKINKGGQAGIQFKQGLIHLSYTLFVFKHLQTM